MADDYLKFFNRRKRTLRRISKDHIAYISTANMKANKRPEVVLILKYREY